MKKITISVISAMCAIGFAGVAIAAATLDGVGTAVVPGEWTSSYSDAKTQADASGVPMVVMWTSPTCSHCDKVKRALNNADFVTWRQDRKLLMVSSEVNSVKDDIKNAPGGNFPTAKFPYMYIYWPAGKVYYKFNAYPDSAIPGSGSSTQMKIASAIDAKLNAYYDGRGNEGSEDDTQEQDPTPVVDPNTVFGGNVNLSAVCYDGDTPVGVLTVKAAKARSGKSKVSGYIYDIYGKKHALTAKYVATGANAKETFSVRGFASIPSVALTFGKSSVSGTFANGGTVVQAKVGGSLSASTVDFSADAGLGDADSLFASGFEVIQDLLPHEGNPEPVSVLNGTRFSTRKAASIKYVKSGGEYVLSGTDDARKPNKSALKLSYKSATGTFSGSYKIYASDACCIDSGKPKLKKLSVKVTGFVVGGEGYGVVTYRNKVIGDAWLFE